MIIGGERSVRLATLDWIRGVGIEVLSGPDLPLGSYATRTTYDEVVWTTVLHAAVKRMNSTLSDAVIERAIHKLTNPHGATLTERNHEFHRMLLNGVEPCTYGNVRDKNAVRVRVIDLNFPARNSWTAVHSFRVSEGGESHCLDIVLLVNGLPLAVIELADLPLSGRSQAICWHRLHRLKSHLPKLFTMNVVVVMADGINARIGTITDDTMAFQEWHTIDGERLAPTFFPEMKTLIRGIFEKSRFVTLLRNYITFETLNGEIRKRIARYYQYQSAEIAFKETLRAGSESRSDTRTNDEIYSHGGSWKWRGIPGDRRIGIVWQVRGSGRNYVAAYLAGRVFRDSRSGIRKLLVISSSDDYVDQAFSAFKACSTILPRLPQWVTKSNDLKALMMSKERNICFVTKSVLSEMNDADSRNHPWTEARIVVIAIEPSRTRYSISDVESSVIRDAIPNSMFIAFTGLPFPLWDMVMHSDYGGCIRRYDIESATIDNVIEPVYYECRAKRIGVGYIEEPRPDRLSNDKVIPHHQAVPQETHLSQDQLYFQKMIEDQDRTDAIARDLVRHCERRRRVIHGRALVICISEEFCAALYESIVRLRPSWHSRFDALGMASRESVFAKSAGSLMPIPGRSGSQYADVIATRVRPKDDSLKLSLVTKSQLAGFDFPTIHTVYILSPMEGVRLNEVLTQTNRCYGDRPGGLVVDYLDLGCQLKREQSHYASGGGRGTILVDRRSVVSEIHRHYSICREFLQDFEWSEWQTLASATVNEIVCGVQDYILSQSGGARCFRRALYALQRSITVAMPHKSAMDLLDDVIFFSLVGGELDRRDRTVYGQRRRGRLEKDGVLQFSKLSSDISGTHSINYKQELAFKRLCNRALSALSEARWVHISIDVLTKLIDMECRKIVAKNLEFTQSSMAALKSIRHRYRKTQIASAEVQADLVELGRRFLALREKRELLGLSENEFAFVQIVERYARIGSNGDEIDSICLSRELVTILEEGLVRDWSRRMGSRTKTVRSITRLMVKHGVRSDDLAKAVQRVLEQARLMDS